MVPGADLAAMFVLGLLGAGHCLGMCAPISMAMTASRPQSSLPTTLLYNLGRGTTYVTIGAIVAGLGEGAGALAPVLRVQAFLTLASAIFLAWFGLALLGLVREPSFGATSIPGAGTLMRRVSGGTVAAALPLGLALGLLPCGLSVAAFTRALGASSALDGGQLVAAFWAGTLPAMLSAGLLVARISPTRRRAAQLLAGTLLVGMAALQVTRVASAL